MISIEEVSFRRMVPYEISCAMRSELMIFCHQMINIKPLYCYESLIGAVYCLRICSCVSQLMGGTLINSVDSAKGNLFEALEQIDSRDINLEVESTRSKTTTFEYLPVETRPTCGTILLVPKKNPRGSMLSNMHKGLYATMINQTLIPSNPSELLHLNNNIIN